MDSLKDLAHALRINATESTLRATLVKNLTITPCLQDSHVVLLLENAYLTRHTHTLRQFLNEVVIALINLLTQFREALRGGVTCWAASLHAQSGLQ